MANIILWMIGTRLSRANEVTNMMMMIMMTCHHILTVSTGHLSFPVSMIRAVIRVLCFCMSAPVLGVSHSIFMDWVSVSVRLSAQWTN